MAEKPCPFCEITQDPSNSRLLADSEHAFVIADGYPVTDGHPLIIPKRHVASFFELTDQERNAVMSLLDAAKIKFEHKYKPVGFKIGINDASAAGQTVSHCHLHLIPRYDEPDKDLHGGNGWLAAEKADYSSEREIV